ncbi:MAG: flagellar biosynthesis protein FliQ [Alphaproteobacteria bacterium]|jgi:flagellar biosynthetic protein FliQ|nr:flagellar biosynthesis protein FliQ [Alphaproteobacteria bacterium]MBL6777766.1 flagellar biosynthesis protein FliQ [Alphaproteobacteria bacterium]
MFDFDMNVEFLRMAMWNIVIISGPVLGVALAIGLVIGIIQAATSINEMTLSFVPKLVVVLLTFGLLANLMLVQLTDYFAFVFDQVAQVG